MSTDYGDIFLVGTTEKLRLVEALWDDIAAQPQAVPVPQWQIDELRRRKVEYLKNPKPTYSWDEVKRFILENHG
ncbi:MAG: addiction module protein [Pirellulales bacterium]